MIDSLRSADTFKLAGLHAVRQVVVPQLNTITVHTVSVWGRQTFNISLVTWYSCNLPFDLPSTWFSTGSRFQLWPGLGKEDSHESTSLQIFRKANGGSESAKGEEGDRLFMEAWSHHPHVWGWSISTQHGECSVLSHCWFNSNYLQVSNV